jgi:hypothetical protein
VQAEPIVAPSCEDHQKFDGDSSCVYYANDMLFDDSKAKAIVKVTNTSGDGDSSCKKDDEERHTNVTLKDQENIVASSDNDNMSFGSMSGHRVVRVRADPFNIDDESENDEVARDYYAERARKQKKIENRMKREKKKREDKQKTVQEKKMDERMKRDKKRKRNEKQQQKLLKTEMQQNKMPTEEELLEHFGIDEDFGGFRDFFLDKLPEQDRISIVNVMNRKKKKKNQEEEKQQKSSLFDDDSDDFRDVFLDKKEQQERTLALNYMNLNKKKHLPEQSSSSNANSSIKKVKKSNNTKKAQTIVGSSVKKVKKSNNTKKAQTIVGSSRKANSSVKKSNTNN